MRHLRQVDAQICNFTANFFAPQLCYDVLGDIITDRFNLFDVINNITKIGLLCWSQQDCRLPTGNTILLR